MKKSVLLLVFVSVLFGCRKGDMSVLPTEPKTATDLGYVTKEAPRRYRTQGCIKQECPGISCIRNSYYDACKRPQSCKCLEAGIMSFYDDIMLTATNPNDWTSVDLNTNRGLRLALWESDPSTFVHPDSTIADTTKGR